MRSDPTLSDQVQDFIDSLDREYERDLRAEGYTAKEIVLDRKRVQVFVQYVLASREAFTDKSRNKLEALVSAVPKLVCEWLDEHYTRELIHQVEGYVSRTMEVPSMDVERTPSKVTDTYLREATRTYILGLPQASVALCRAALEQTLKESLGYQSSGAFITFQKLVDDAVRWNLFSEGTAKLVRKLAKEGDDVLHEKPTTPDRAKDVLATTRSVIRRIYSAKLPVS